jgi:anti-sigma factor RsiW
LIGREAEDGCGAEPLDNACAQVKGKFSDYLDGALNGHAMRALAAHFETCRSCSAEFQAWRSVQSVLGDLGPAKPPSALQARLRDALAGERDRRTFLSPSRRVADFWDRTLAPMCLRVSGGLAAALVLIGSAIWFIGSAAPVQANDDRLANLNPPQFLYSQMPPEPISAKGPFVAVLVEAKVNSEGRVYDYSVLDGPKDSETRARIEANLLGSIFKPATVFGVPVPGHAMMTYTTVSVRG